MQSLGIETITFIHNISFELTLRVITRIWSQPKLICLHPNIISFMLERLIEHKNLAHSVFTYLIGITRLLYNVDDRLNKSVDEFYTIVTAQNCLDSIETFHSTNPIEKVSQEINVFL